MSALAFDLALGLCAADDGRSFDAAAGGSPELLAVADGFGGHDTGWLAARLAIRELYRGAASPRYAGAADLMPDEWGWAGARLTRDEAETIYEATEQLLEHAERGSLASVFARLARALARIPELPYRMSVPLAGCTAMRLEGTALVGAHIGVGRALLLRRGASTCESLVQEHYLHEIVGRLPEHQRGYPVPPNVIAGCLGGSSMAGVDTLREGVAAGDVLVLCSRRLACSDDQLAAALAFDASPEDRVRRLIDMHLVAASERRHRVAIALGIASTL